MGRKPGEINTRHTVVVSFAGHSEEARNLITKQAKRQPTTVDTDGGNTRLVYTYKYHASAEKVMNKIINLNANPMEFKIDGLTASIVG